MFLNGFLLGTHYLCNTIHFMEHIGNVYIMEHTGKHWRILSYISKQVSRNQGRSLHCGSEDSHEKSLGGWTGLSKS